MPRLRWVAIALCMFAGSCAGQAADDETFAPPDARGWGRVAGFDYLEVVRGGARADERLPMVVVIHGRCGEPGPDWLQFAPPSDVRVRVIMPRAPTRCRRGIGWLSYEVGGYRWFPYELGDERSDGLAKTLGPRAQQLAAALQLLQARRPTLGQPIVTGFSQGGMLSFALATRYPERFALVAPISGCLPDALWPERAPAGAARLPIRALHGARDGLVPIQPARELTERLRQLGYDATLREFPQLGHDVSPELLEQAMQQLTAALP